MQTLRWLAFAGAAAALGTGGSALEERLWHHRNLGKAFYENPATPKEAVEEFRKALELAPNSSRERLNYGLALLRAGRTREGAAELERVQKNDPALPHTWFNLGILYKKEGALDRAVAQFRRMIALAPDEPVAHYNLGALYRAQGKLPEAMAEFEAAARLNPQLAAPHFQLYNLYRQLRRPDDAARELGLFQAGGREDMDWSAYAEIYDPGEAKPVPAAAQPTYKAERIAARTEDLALLDFDGDGRPDLLAWSRDGVRLFRGGTREMPGAGLAGLKDVTAAAAGDFDNDGRPDLCVASGGTVALYRNENGAFRKFAQLGTGRYRKAVWLDYDHDYDLDLLLLGGQAALYRNNGAAGFSDETKRFPFVAGDALDAVRFEEVRDTPGFDLVVSYRGRPAVLYRDRLGGRYEAVPLDGPGPPATASPGVLADFDGDGREDRARIAPDGALILERNITPNAGHWVEVALTGVKNLKLAAGAKVEVKAGSLYRKGLYDGLPLSFALGGEAQVDTVRVTWPNGLIQNETKPTVDRVLRIKEAPRLSGSCPMIFTWNGERFEFLTDVLGVAPLGASSGDGQYFPVDHDEYVQVPAEALKAADGAYEIRITEELREVSYLDEVRLIALDHPANLEIFTNDKFKSPPFPEFRLFGVARRIYPIAARGQRGEDVLPRLLHKDRRYPDGFRRDGAGTAELHSLELDFGGAEGVLILNGWVDWADGSTFLAAAQQHRDLIFPYLQVKDAQGEWRTVIEDMGIPAGKPKTIAVDLRGKFLSSSRKLRIVTNLCVYWDEIFMTESSGPPPVRMTPLQPSSAELRFRGFSRATIDPERKQPEWFDYSDVSPVSMWNPTPGLYTRYGDVRALVAAADDRMAIMGSGDELRLRFDAAALPAPPAGWRRDFLLFVDGWAKDADANTAFSQSVEPLPFHGMSRYPYPEAERFPGTSEYNTRPALRLIRPLGGLP